MEAVKQAISDELERIEESAQYSAQTQFSSTKFWRGLNLTLGVPAAALAAIAGATTLGKVVSSATAGVLALAAAALAGALTTLNAAQRAEQSRVAASAYLALQADARVARTIDLPGMSMDDARQRLDELIERRNAVNDQAPVAAFLAYKLGSRNIKTERQVYEIDKAK